LVVGRRVGMRVGVRVGNGRAVGGRLVAKTGGLAVAARVGATKVLVATRGGLAEVGVGDGIIVPVRVLVGVAVGEFAGVSVGVGVIVGVQVAGSANEAKIGVGGSGRSDAMGFTRGFKKIRT